MREAERGGPKARALASKTRAPPNKPTAASAVREDGGVVWSSDGAPFAHPVWSCLIIAYGFIHDIL